MDRNWRDISYLDLGMPRQRGAYANLVELGILKVLAEFDAVLVSTVNTGIDRESSDLDVICEVGNMELFEALLVSLYGKKPGFKLSRSDRDPPALVASFHHHDWEYEVFGQAVPVERQNAYRHLVQTDRVISLGGETWRDAIRTLKRGGMKTEPAVAYCLQLKGEPYQAVLGLEQLSDDEMRDLLRAGRCT